MKKLSYHIDSYKAEYESALLELERLTPQGKGVKLEMVRPDFLSRSKIFDKHFVFVALNRTKKKIIGVAAVSIVPIKIDNRLTNVGFGYDLKVHPAYQNRGIAKDFAECLIDVYLADNEISEYFTTFKSSNKSMTSVVQFIKRKWCTYEFFYLTIPTFKRVRFTEVEGEDQLLSIEMFGDTDTLKDYCITTNSELKVWKTYATYQLKIQAMPWSLNMGAKCINRFRAKSRRIPEKGDLLKFATLYGYNRSNIGSVNDVLEILQKRNIQYLNVCCIQGDFIYNLFDPVAVNKMSYSLLNTFGSANGQKLSLDVRCL